MGRKILAIIIAIFAIILLINGASAQLADSPWPTFHGDSQRTGLSPYDTSHVDGTIKWTFEAEDGFEASPSIGADGTIYIGSHDGYLYAVNSDGSLKWKYKIGTPIIKEDYGHLTSTLSTPAIDSDGTIYIASRDQYLFAITSEGKLKWKFPVDIRFDHWGSPAIGADGTVYIVSSTPRPGLIAINPDGTEKWYYASGADAFNSPSIGKDGTIYAALPLTTKSFAVIALNPDGTEKWIAETDLFLESTPSIGPDGTIYVGSFSETGTGAGLYAISSAGKVKWHFGDEKIREVMSTPAIAKDGTIYVGMYEGIFYAINPDGTAKWKIDLDGEIGSSPVIGADGTIYFGYSAFGRGKDSFYAVNPDGSIKWTALKERSVGSSPAIDSDGTIYVANWDKKLYAFGETDTPVVEKKVRSGPGIEYEEVDLEPLPGQEGHVEPKAPLENNLPLEYIIGAFAIIVVAGLLFKFKKKK